MSYLTKIEGIKITPSFHTILILNKFFSHGQFVFKFFTATMKVIFLKIISLESI